MGWARSTEGIRSRGLRLASRVGIGIASGCSTSLGWGSDCDKPLDSLASTFCVLIGLAGRGIVETSVALMASPPVPVPAPQFSPGKCTTEYTTMAANNRPCRTADQASGRRQGSCSKKMSALAAMFLQRLSYDAHVGDA